MILLQWLFSAATPTVHTGLQALGWLAGWHMSAGEPPAFDFDAGDPRGHVRHYSQTHGVPMSRASRSAQLS